MPELKAYLLEEATFDAEWHQALFALLDKGAFSAFISSAHPYSPDSQPLVDALSYVASHYAPSGWEGALDGIDRSSIGGWIKRCDSDKSQFVTLSIDFTPAYECFLAASFRPDVKKAFGGNGCHGFRLLLPDQKSNPGFMTATLEEPFSSNILVARFYTLHS